MKKMNYALLVLLAFVLASCSAYKQVPYLQASEYLDTSGQNTPLYDARIMPKDLLTITVNTTDPETAAPFNLTVATAVSNQNRSLTSQPVLQQYLVDNKGNIDFPVLGSLHIGGLTKSEAENLIREKLKTYITEVPIVNVRMANYKISVMGEVTKPGSFVITNEKVNLFEALAMAGDMTIYGQRDNVKLIREDAQGHREIIPLNLNDASIVLSPYYYLQQNDVIYVTPNKTKAKNAGISNSTTIMVLRSGYTRVACQPYCYYFPIKQPDFIMKENLYDDLYTEQEEQVDYKALFFKYLIHWKWFVASIVVCLIGGWIYLHYTTPVYSITGSVIIKDNKKNSSAGTGLGDLEDLGFYSSTSNFDNEVEVLHSRTLLKKVVEELDLYINYRTRENLRPVELYKDTPVKVWLTPEEAEKPAQWRSSA